MSKMMIPLGRKQTYDRTKAEADFDVPYAFELAGPYGGHFHFWLPLDCNSNFAKEMAKLMQRQREVSTYSWDYDPMWEPMESKVEATGARVLKEEEAINDYDLVDGQDSCWVTVGNISVYILRGDEGVDIALYPHYDEMADPLAWCSAKYPEEEVS
jgi:hypothetical protein